MPGPYEPENAFFGALLHMPAPLAGQALDAIEDGDFGDHINVLIVRVIRKLIAENVKPDPVAVLARARADGTVAEVEATRAFSMRLVDLYAAVPTPGSWRYYHLGLVDEALRRRCTEMGKRIMQAAQSCSLDVLVDLLDAECRVVRRLRDRRADAGANASLAQLRAVGA